MVSQAAASEVGACHPLIRCLNQARAASCYLSEVKTTTAASR